MRPLSKSVLSQFGLMIGCANGSLDASPTVPREVGVRRQMTMLTYDLVGSASSLGKVPCYTSASASDLD
jgi:hypothetical protein